nr:MAG TPA: hypothetical protein [Caudoviricetes sp.]
MPHFKINFTTWGNIYPGGYQFILHYIFKKKECLL